MSYRAVFAFALLLLSSFLCAEGNDSSPPELPSSEGMLIVKAVYSNGTEMASLPIVVLARSNSSVTVFRLVSDSSGKLILSLGSTGRYELDALVNLAETPGADFASTASALLPSNSTVTMVFQPAGSITGRVQQDGLPVPHATVHVACPSNSFDYERINGATEAKSGEAGDFMFLALPSGTCIVSSSTDSLAASEEVSIVPGVTKSIALELKRKASAPGEITPPAAFINPFDFAAGMLAVIILAVIYFAFIRKKKEEGKAAAMPAHEEKDETPAPAKAKASKQKKEKGRLAQDDGNKEATLSPPTHDIRSPHVKAVLSTLSDREQEIVKYLFANGGRAKRSSMQHKLLIPKTSMIRNLRSLERKNVVKLTPFGRNMVAEISDLLKKQ